ncbi:Zinc uptake regulation protein Zur [hydrothermal vent metagenome]|uniref:Zinc uptake regulation protein Zur n=1 Tax=hydrothermal vent metagenome TaxID=652676 RepID=A0A3B1B932_9ZZZZ
MSTDIHDHDKCIESALNIARDICAERDTRFTPLRRKVLELVWEGHAPVTAYELLDMLSNAGKKRVAPPTIYRALDFLIEEGFVHRIESLNAFIGCPDPAHTHQGHFLICRKCRNVSEVNDAKLMSHISKAAASHGYSCENSMLEIMGLCANCQN